LIVLLHHREHSRAGEPLLILHGLFGNHANWGWHAARLAKRFAVYGLDLRNHGASPHGDDMSYATMVGDVLGWLDSQGMASCHLLGHSLGGKVAMQLALDSPQRVRKLVVVDIAPVEYPKSSASSRYAWLAALRELPVGEIETRAEADERLRRVIASRELRQFLLTNLERLPEGGYRWRLQLAAIEANLPALFAAPSTLGPFPGPALFLFGEQSEYRRDADRGLIGRLFPEAELQVLPRAGHWLHVEQPEASLAAIENFLLQDDDDRQCPA